MRIFVLRGHWWNPVDAIIMWRSKSPYNHCGVILDNDVIAGDIIDATVGGVKKRNLHKDWKGYTAEVYEYLYPLPEKQMYQWLEGELNDEYDYVSWLGFATGIQQFQNQNQWFCSELVYWMFEEAGYPLTPEPLTFMFPSFFPKSHFFTRIK